MGKRLLFIGTVMVIVGFGFGVWAISRGSQAFSDVKSIVDDPAIGVATLFIPEPAAFWGTGNEMSLWIDEHATCRVDGPDGVIELSVNRGHGFEMAGTFPTANGAAYQVICEGQDGTQMVIIDATPGSVLGPAFPVLLAGSLSGLFLLGGIGFVVAGLVVWSRERGHAAAVRSGATTSAGPETRSRQPTLTTDRFPASPPQQTPDQSAIPTQPPPPRPPPPPRQPPPPRSPGSRPPGEL